MSRQSGLENKGLMENGSAVVSNRGENGQTADPELAEVMDRWTGLPKAIKAAIMTLARQGDSE